METLLRSTRIAGMENFSMSRRWIRIDSAHQSFDCSANEFDRLLSEAQSNVDLPCQLKREVYNPSDVPSMDDCRLIEAINAELAELTNLQRRDRLSEQESSRHQRAQEHAIHGKMLADLHAASLRQSS